MAVSVTTARAVIGQSSNRSILFRVITTVRIKNSGGSGGARGGGGLVMMGGTLVLLSSMCVM